jgi:hypothetical protein
MHRVRATKLDRSERNLNPLTSMRMRSRPLQPFTLSAALGLACATAPGCGSSGQEQLSLGHDDGGPSFAFSGGDARGQAGLDAYVEQNQVEVKIVTLSCSGDCATVQAVGTGGYPPYTFTWDDGSTSATRQVCPTSSTSYSVKVTDTGTSGELARAPETVQVPLTADVLVCPDGGAAPSDSGASGCVTLLESSVSGPLTGTGAITCSPSGESGAYGALATLQQGQEYQIVENVMGSGWIGTTPTWSFYGATTDCNGPPSGQLLGSMPDAPGTRSFCFRANADYSNVNWYLSNQAGGYAVGLYQLCGGCSDDGGP